MIVKVRIKEAFGVNTEIALCQQPDDCMANSLQVGTSEILLAQVYKGSSYYLELSFAKSII